jgi:hypothetical protein
MLDKNALKKAIGRYRTKYNYSSKPEAGGATI